MVLALFFSAVGKSFDLFFTFFSCVKIQLMEEELILFFFFHLLVGGLVGGSW